MSSYDQAKSGQERLDTVRRLQLVALKHVCQRSEKDSTSAAGTLSFV